MWRPYPPSCRGVEPALLWGASSLDPRHGAPAVLKDEGHCPLPDRCRNGAGAGAGSQRPDEHPVSGCADDKALASLCKQGCRQATRSRAGPLGRDSGPPTRRPPALPGAWPCVGAPATAARSLGGGKREGGRGTEGRRGVGREREGRESRAGTQRTETRDELRLREEEQLGQRGGQGHGPGAGPPRAQRADGPRQLAVGHRASVAFLPAKKRTSLSLHCHSKESKWGRHCGHWKKGTDALSPLRAAAEGQATGPCSSVQ